MAKTLTLSGPTFGVIANQPATFTIRLANTDAASVFLQSLVVNEATESDAIVGQPSFMPAGQPASVFPTLAASGTLAYTFQVVFTSPNTPGVSATNPGGAAPGQEAMEADANFVLQATAMLSDGTMLMANLAVPALSAVYPFPVSDAGTTLFRQGGNSNLIAVIA